MFVLKFSKQLLITLIQAWIVFTIVSSCSVKSQSLSESKNQIRVNQVGYLSQNRKLAVISAPSTENFTVLDIDNQPVFTGQLLPTVYWDKSDEMTAIADFTAFQSPGMYHISSGDDISPNFQIGEFSFLQLIKAATKSYYFNRASTALDEQYASVFKRSFSHPDTSVVVHASVSTNQLIKGSILATPYGWYDAGDFNKYIVNSGITMFTLLEAYEQNKDLFDTLSWNIPESKNELPDIIDEVLWNLKWMETMQDPIDGGVFHKTTTADFVRFMEASKASSKRFVMPKGTAATLNFCAVLAKSSRVMRKWDPEYSSQLIKKSLAAWSWAKSNPNVVFKNPTSVNPDFPPVRTGEYGDSYFGDEFFWAAIELFLATGEEGYLKEYPITNIPEFDIPNWNSVATLGLISLVSSDVQDVLKKEAADELKNLADALTTTWREAPYRITLKKFTWGSNAVILNESMVLINAYKSLGRVEYYEAALSGLDYALGRNATGYCFVTGFGERSPMHIHHRQSASDGIAEPIQGFLVGGPNPKNINEDCGVEAYVNKFPAKCYLDNECSYSTNEVAINWNAPLVYVVGSLQSIYQSDFKANNN